MKRQALSTDWGTMNLTFTARALTFLESKRPVCSVIKEYRLLGNLLTLVCWSGGTRFYYKEGSRSRGSEDFDSGLHLGWYIYNSTTLVNLFHFSWTQVLQIWGENDKSMEHRELLGRWVRWGLQFTYNITGQILRLKDFSYPSSCEVTESWRIQKKTIKVRPRICTLRWLSPCYIL